MNNPRCLVLFATYNGEKYIHELLNSLPFDVDILVSDDCSNDNTISIIESYKI
ncbi:glycosyltransferase [Escherichia coli]|uniref:glycosyltransferase n=1 Tax=Escherichia coli TaxID=562 RepID=UPI000F547585